MTKKRLRILIATVAAFIALTSAITLISVRSAANKRVKPASIAFAQPWDDEGMIAALNRALARFRTLYPEVSVTVLAPADATAAQADVRCFTDPVVLSQPWAAPPSPWTGNAWLLAARKDVLDRVAKALPKETAALRSGECTPEQFRLLAEEIAKSGTAPLTLGNSHKWPFMLLLEHWTAAVAGPEAVMKLPEADDKAANAAFEELMRWKTRGWFAPNLWDQGWAAGLLPLDRGEAAFALVSAEYLSPIPPQRRSALEFLAFPHRASDPPWSIGSATWIGAAAAAASPEAAKLLVKYLTSPGVTGELTLLTGQPFFTWDAKSGKMPTVAPNWALADQSPEYRKLIERFEPGE